jgi:integrase
VRFASAAASTGFGTTAKRAARRGKRELSALKRMFTLAIQAGKLLQRPHIPMLVERNVRKGFFERAQFEAVRHRLPPTYQGLVTLAYYTGWRVNSELLTLEWHRVDRAASVIRLEPGTTKNDRGRTFKYAELDELVAAVDGRRRATTRWRSRASSTPRTADTHVLEAVADRLRSGRVCRPDPACLPADRCPEPQSGRRDRNGGHEDHRPQNPQRVRPLRHHERRGSRGGVAQAAGARRDNCENGRRGAEIQSR